ncbi:MAG: AI-2E family transporter [Planctomycetes bacterium]|nr:AI-2E family transporter [Planctomycetota bacterium]
MAKKKKKQGGNQPGAKPPAASPSKQNAAPKPPASRDESRDTVMLPATLKNALRADYSQLLRIRNVQWLIVIAAVVGALFLGYYLSAVFVPLLVAMAIAYILNPLVKGLEKRGVSRTRAVLLIFVAFLAASAAVGSWFVASVVRDVEGMGNQLGEMLQEFKDHQDEWIADWNNNTPTELHLDPKEDPFGRVTELAIEKFAPTSSKVESPEAATARASMVAARADLMGAFQRADVNSNLVLDRSEIDEAEFDLMDGNKDGRVSVNEWLLRFGATVPEEDGRTLSKGGAKAAEGIVGVVSSGLLSIFTLLLFITLVPIYTFYFMVGWEKVVARGREYLPGNHRPRIERILGKIDGMLKAFFRGRMVIVCIITVLTTTVYLVFGVKYAVLLGLLGGIGVLIPYAAMVFSWIPAVIVMAIDPNAGVVAIVAMSLCFHGIQALEQFVLTPKLLGNAVELHPVTVLVGVFVMFSLFGLFGALLAVPLTAIAKTLGREFLLPYFKSLAAVKPKPAGET